MKVMVIGNGGAAHAFVTKINKYPNISVIICAPVNPGIEDVEKVIGYEPACINNPVAYLNIALLEEVDFTIVFPEILLSYGIVDIFEANGLKIFGPNRAAAIIENSKVFMKDFCNKYKIPTAHYATFTSSGTAKLFMEDHPAFLKSEKSPKFVVKADGLAQGKGVIICNDESSTFSAIKEIMDDRIFGDAGERIVIEEFLEGMEFSFMVLTDGYSIIPLAVSRDYKKIYDGDKGANTGGMGSFSSDKIISKELQQEIIKDIIQPTIDNMRKEGYPYKGLLYAGLILTNDGVKVLEFNSRFGDPETQAVLMRLNTEFLGVLEATTNQRLHEYKLNWKNESSVCVVLVSRGYPNSYRKGDIITIPRDIETRQDIEIYHSGTAYNTHGNLVTSGGRVLNVTALGKTLKDATKKAYEVVDRIEFTGKYTRRDIGYTS